MADNIRALKGVQYKKSGLFFRERQLKQEVFLKQAPESPAKLGHPISRKEVSVPKIGLGLKQTTSTESEVRKSSEATAK